ncbi:IS3 family transposase [Yersinia proxima]|uniref:IS3 family transposase n=1 Tax=Yersinia proxima TaxID=2890316 RepID=UPI0011154E15|nr:IS3 family transposase [Yersinia proxima]
MKLEKAGANIQQVCHCLSLTRSVFYARSRRLLIKSYAVILHAAAKHVHAEMDMIYGSRRMCIELWEQGFNVGRYRVRQMMKTLMFVAKRPGRHRYPRGGKPAVIAANLLNWQFNPDTLNTWWSGYITYLRTAKGWLYLAIVMDLCSRKIVSCTFSDKSDIALTIRALRLAVNKQRPTGSVVFHSDQGAQYTSAQFQYCQNELGVTGSMSRKCNCLDNAVTERFFRSLKAERVNYRRYETRSQGIAYIINYIDSYL